uniref:BTB domain-containing protein n=1 Tax=Rhabditophanes sp. KR3021 TaxID=114890 RepID=A0AC35TU66_9BILA
MFSDFKIKCKDGVVETSKVVLFGHNDYFRDYFLKDPTSESYQCPKLTLEDVNTYLGYVFNYESFKIEENNLYQLLNSYHEFKCEDMKKLYDARAFEAADYNTLLEIFDVDFIKQNNQKQICRVFNRWVEYDFAERKVFWKELLHKLDFTRLSKMFVKSELIENPQLKAVPEIPFYLLESTYLKKTVKSINDIENIFLVGGSCKGGTCILNYDIQDKKIEEFGNLKFERNSAAAELFDNKLIVFGGYQSKKMETFDLVTKKSEVLDSEIDEIKTWFSTIKLNEQIWSFGGWINDKEGTNIVQSYDFEKMTWFTKKPLPVNSCGHSSVMIDNVVYITPGSVNNGNVHRCDARVKTWETLAEIAIKRQNAAVSLLDNNILYTGGIYHSNKKWLDKNFCDIYDVRANKWRSTLELPVAHRGNKTFEFAKEILAFGGYSNDKNQKDIYSFDKKTEIWSKYKLQLPFANSNFALLYY